jgi:hypothetical protein
MKLSLPPNIIIIYYFPKKINGHNHHRGDKKKGQKTHRSQELKKVEKLILLVVGNYFTHNPFNVTCMQIVIFNNNERSKTSIIRQCNLPLYNKG